MKNLLLLFFITITTWTSAQTPAEKRINSFEQRQQLENNSIINAIPFRSVGPSVFGGRVVDLSVNEQNPSEFYVAYASGGLWKTDNNGMSFSPLFDKEAVMTIGDIAVNWKDDIIWMGTGENNSSRSSYAGIGMYKSTDQGKTWQHKGLGESHHIGRIILHPTDPNTVWVAALGHLYTPNLQRGIYKTTNGGETWQQTLSVDENSGAIDLVIDPNNPDVLYTASWDRERRAWNFVESGNGSGIHKSTDGGNSWTLMTTEKSGFPTGEGTGRIGLAITKENEKTILYAVLDNYNRRPKEAEEEDEVLEKDDIRDLSKAEFLALEKEAVAEFLDENGFPEKYSADSVIAMVKREEIKPIALVEYLEDANSLLFDTPVVGAEVYRSDNGGKKWTKTHDDYIDDLFFSYGYYFGQIRVDPQNSQQLYLGGVFSVKSSDGGKTFAGMQGDNVHLDHHALWINPNKKGHIINGNDGGVNISYDNGEHWVKCNTPAVGQFYTVAVDDAEPYNIYGGLQDNGVWTGSSTYEAGVGWHNSGHYPYKELMGGDGMHIAIDNRDNTTVYTGYQFGNYYRINKNTGQSKYITPKHDLGERPLRWNWQTPIHLSIHNQDILYMGSNKLHRSFNKGDDFEAISDDLTTGGKKGDVAFSTLTSIHESPLKFGLLYVGTDDGLVHVSKDGGHSWQQIMDGLPKDRWVTRVQASTHDLATVYVTLNGYRNDDFSAYVYKSKNYGKTWQPIGEDLPMEPVNVIKEDPENKAILYVGTDHALYVSLDGGSDFMLMNNGLPAVAVHDLVIHKKTGDLVVGTHGRSIYVANVAALEQLNVSVMAKPLHVFDIKSVKYSGDWGQSWAEWIAVDTPNVAIPIFVNEAGSVDIKIQADSSLVLQSFSQKCDKGLNFIQYDLTIDEDQVENYKEFLNKEADKEVKLKEAKRTEKYYLQKGKYQIIINNKREEVEGILKIK